MVIGLAVIALLLLLGLLCCVVLVVFLFRRPRLAGTGFGGRDGALEFTHARLDFVNDPDIQVVVHHPSLSGVVRVPDRSGTQADLAQVCGFDAGYGQAHRQREESHAERHGKARLADRGPDRLEQRGLHVLPPGNAWLERTCGDSQALGVNARCGCQDVGGHAGWRLHLRETLQPIAARISYSEQRSTRLANVGVGLEAVESGPAQDAVEASESRSSNSL